MLTNMPLATVIHFNQLCYAYGLCVIKSSLPSGCILLLSASKMLLANATPNRTLKTVQKLSM